MILLKEFSSAIRKTLLGRADLLYCLGRHELEGKEETADLFGYERKCHESKAPVNPLGGQGGVESGIDQRTTLNHNLPVTPETPPTALTPPQAFAPWHRSWKFPHNPLGEKYFGYKLLQQEIKPQTTSPAGRDRIAAEIDASPPERLPNRQPTPIRFYRVVESRPTPPETQRDSPVGWEARLSPLMGEDISDHNQRPPLPAPLTPWPRLWPFLRAALGVENHSHHIDLTRLVDNLSRGRQLRNLPKLHRRGWAPVCQVLVDLSPRLLPFWGDFHRLCTALTHLRGMAGLEVLHFADGPEGPCRPWHPNSRQRRRLRAYHLPESGTPVLLLSDLGCLLSDNEPQHKDDGDDDGLSPHSEGPRRHWLHFGKRLRQAGLSPVALLPCPSRLWDKELARLFFSVVWDRDGRPPRRLGTKHPVPVPDVGSRAAGTHRLLRLISPAVRVEPSLLRAIRTLLPPEESDVGCEAAVWHHPEVWSSPTALTLQWQQIPAWRRAFMDEVPANLKREVASLIRAHHAHLSPIVAAEEEVILACSLDEPADQVRLDYLRRAFLTLRDAPEYPFQEDLRAYALDMGERQEEGIWTSNQGEPLAALLALTKAQAAGEAVDTTYPVGFDCNRVRWVLNQSDDPPQWFSLKQEGRHFTLHAQGEEKTESAHFQTASPLRQIRLRHSRVQWMTEDETGRLSHPKDRDLRRTNVFEIPQQPRLHLIGSEEALVIEGISRPEWAQRIGQDEYGLYADFVYQGHSQRFRWIAPGWFWMGSPLHEPDRSPAETSHEVILTYGYWLADTTCTQALWQAVMGKNPSCFKGDEHPVEQVSWEDVQSFLDRLNRLTPGLEARLPTEAEWEYACRAGTETPFGLGKNITLEEVNYNGSPYPSYVDGHRAVGYIGHGRLETVAVHVLSCNGWGLYQMHGNVWEWCADWLERYPSGPSIDPVGPSLGIDRVLRGGGGLDSSWNCRSAARSGYNPEKCFALYGFRLARGQMPGRTNR